MANSKQVIFITGANTGLGLETVKSLLKSSRPVIILLGSRDLQKGTAAAEEVRKQFADSQSKVECVQIDVESDKSIEQAFETIQAKYHKVDVLINNAGAMFDQMFSQGPWSLREMWNKSWDVNVAGTFVTTHTFVPLLLKSSKPRLIFITSGTSSLGEHGSQTLPINKAPPAGWPKQTLMVPAYRSVKTGLNMQMAEWHRILKEDGVKVFSISPGMLATGLGGLGPEALRKMGALEPHIGADFIRDVAEGRRDQDVGKVIRKDMVQAF